MSAGVAGPPLVGCDVVHNPLGRVKRRSDVLGQRRTGHSVPSVAARRLDGDKVVKIEVDDCLERLAGSAVAQRFGEMIEAGRHIPPAARRVRRRHHASAGLGCGGRRCAGNGLPGRVAGGAVPGLSLGIGHRAVGEGSAGHEVHSEALRNGMQWLAGSVNRPRGRPGPGVFDAGCRRRDRCGGRFARALSPTGC